MADSVRERGPNANTRPPPISAAPAGKFWNQEDQKWRNFVQLTLPPAIKRKRPSRKNRKSCKERKSRKN